jgi:hypothetical protein
MAEVAQMELLTASQVAQQTPVRQSENRLSYAIFADTHITAQELEPIVQAVPNAVAAALTRHAYYFVPLTIGETEETMVAPGYTIDLVTVPCAIAMCSSMAPIASSSPPG